MTAWGHAWPRRLARGRAQLWRFALAAHQPRAGRFRIRYRPLAPRRAPVGSSAETSGGAQPPDRCFQRASARLHAADSPWPGLYGAAANESQPNNNQGIETR
jgi:hypothetical protein